MPQALHNAAHFAAFTFRVHQPVGEMRDRVEKDQGTAAFDEDAQLLCGRWIERIDLGEKDRLIRSGVKV